jgi:hypothetical protein
MKRTLSITVALAALVAVIAIVTASGSTSSAGRATTIHLDFKLTSVKAVDAAPKGQSPGDFGVVAGDLLSPGSTEKIGHYQGVCFTMTPASNSECTFTYSLPSGQLTTTTAYGRGFNGENIVHDAVVGGTRAYRNARGEGIGKETGDTTGIETFHVTS